MAAQVDQSTPSLKVVLVEVPQLEFHPSNLHGITVLIQNLIIRCDPSTSFVTGERSESWGILEDWRSAYSQASRVRRLRVGGIRIAGIRV